MGVESAESAEKTGFRQNTVMQSVSKAAKNATGTAFQRKSRIDTFSLFSYSTAFSS